MTSGCICMLHFLQWSMNKWVNIGKGKQKRWINERKRKKEKTQAITITAKALAS